MIYSVVLHIRAVVEDTGIERVGWSEHLLRNHFSRISLVITFLLDVCGAPALFLITIHGLSIYHGYVTLMNSTTSFAHHCMERSF